MLSRALSLATVTLLIGCFATDRALAQATNLEAGKNPSQIFAGTCTACHKSPRGLLKSVPAGSLSGFLRQHYTTSSEMAAALSSYLVANGAADTRAGTQAKPGKDAKTEAKPGASPEQLDRQGHRVHPGAAPQEAARPETQPQQAAKPDAEGRSPEGEPGRHGRNAKRLARPGEAPEGAKPGAEGQPPAHAERENEFDRRKSRLKLGRRGKPGSEEPPKSDAAKQEPGEPVDKPKSATAKDEGNKPSEGDKPSGEAAKIEAPKAAGSETPVLRADPVPAVTPAPKPAEGETHPVQTAVPAPASTPAAPAAAAAEPVAPAPTVTAAAPPPPPPVAPAGPPAPPISQ